MRQFVHMLIRFLIVEYLLFNIKQTVVSGMWLLLKTSI